MRTGHPIVFFVPVASCRAPPRSARQLDAEPACAQRAQSMNDAMLLACRGLTPAQGLAGQGCASSVAMLALGRAGMCQSSARAQRAVALAAEWCRASAAC